MAVPMVGERPQWSQCADIYWKEKGRSPSVLAYAGGRGYTTYANNYNAIISSGLEPHWCGWMAAS